MDTKKTLVRGELVLPVIVVMNSFGVVLMLYSGTGIYDICIERSASGIFPGNMDVYFSEHAGAQPDDPEKKICAAVPSELRRWICVRAYDGCA